MAQQHQPRHDQPQVSHQVAKVTTAVTVGGSLMVFSGLALAATVIGLVMATPLLVLFSPVLLPAATAILLIGAGFLTSGALGTAAALGLYWMYRYTTGKHPVGADQVDRVRQRIGGAATGLTDRAEQFGPQHL
ncbi:hypothetical protein NMG60_11027388 [Bertholletia excelsa]